MDVRLGMASPFCLLNSELEFGSGILVSWDLMAKARVEVIQKLELEW